MALIHSSDSCAVGDQTFVAIGALEALTFLLALYSAARIPGGLIGVLGQGGLLFSVLFSRLFLGTRFDALQVTPPSELNPKP